MKIAFCAMLIALCAGCKSEPRESSQASGAAVPVKPCSKYAYAFPECGRGGVHHERRERDRTGEIEFGIPIGHGYYMGVDGMSYGVKLGGGLHMNLW